MKQKRYQVFISSTFSDLKAERLAVLNQLLSINCIPVGMELFPAADEEQFEYIKRLIDESDYYVVIIAGRYGSLADDGFSYTEKEYDYAVSKEIPVLRFLHEHPENIPSGLTDPENAIKLAEFKKKVSARRLVKYWTTADNLSTQVQTALFNAFESKPRTGWVRADSVMATEQLEEKLERSQKINDEDKKTIDSLRRECEGLNEKLDESLSRIEQLSQQLAIALTSPQQSQLPLKDVEPLKKNSSFYIGHLNGNPLEWLILEKQPGRVLLIAKDCLLKAPYNEEQERVTWADCSLRYKVLSDIMKQIFDDKERSKVLHQHNRNNDNATFSTQGGIDTDDYLFLLSIDEVTQYFPDTETRIAYLNGKAMWWWLRSPGYDSRGAASVYPDGNVDDSGHVVHWSGAVRPAFWLNLQS